MANPHPSAASSPSAHRIHHLHLPEDVCPLCEQQIPHDRAEEVAERMRVQERQQATAIAARLSEKYQAEKVEALDRARLEANEQITAAREEARVAAETQSRTQIEQAEQDCVAAQEALRRKTEEAESVRACAEAAQAALRNELDQAKRDGEAALKKMTTDAAEKEAVIRADAARAADEDAAGKIAQATAEKRAAEEAGAAALAQLEDTRRDSETALAQAKATADEREAAARIEAAASAVSAASQRIAEAEQARVDADAKAAEAAAQVNDLQRAHAAELTDRLQEQREALETAKTTAINAEKSAAFEERLKLSNKVDELQRALEKKTAEELGEGAEIDLFEGLKAEFENDRIERVNKGQPGADILHTVIHNGHECGTIIYDSKNHAAWRKDFVTKLNADKQAAGAAHAILSTRSFPSGERQLHVLDGVMIAGPKRVVALVQIVRGHLIHAHSLTMSKEERTQKTAALYSFITSQQCADLFARLDEQAEHLLDIQTKEKKAHEAVWKQQGLAIRLSMKVQAELRNQIDSIIGLAPFPEVAS